MNLFVQFLSAQMLRNGRVQLGRIHEPKLERTLACVLRLFELSGGGKVIVPTISITESPIYDTLARTEEFQFSLAQSQVIFSGSAIDANAWMENKRKHYDRSGLFTVYFERELLNRLSSYEPFFQKRLRSSTREVARGWVALVQKALDGQPSDLKFVQFLRDAIGDVGAFKSLKAKDRLLMAPHKLGGQALVWEILKSQNLMGIRDEYYDQIEDAFQALLSYVWIDSHCSEYNARIATNIPYLGRMDCGYKDDVPANCMDIPDAVDAIGRFGLVWALLELPMPELAVLSRSRQWTDLRTKTGLLSEPKAVDGHIQLAVRDHFEGKTDRTVKPKIREVLDGLDRAVEWLDSGRVTTLFVPNRYRRISPQGPQLKRVVMATANKRENSAILELLGSTAESTAPRFVGRATNLPRWECTLTCPNGEVELALAQADETGGDEAVDLLRRAIGELDPDAVFFVGCAALLDEKEALQPNTVYLARRGIDSDKMQLNDGQATYDMEQHPGDLRIRRVLSALNAGGFGNSINLVTNRDFISGSAFFATRKAERRKDLIDRYPGDAVVLEMEAFAVYKEVFKLRSLGWDGAVSVIKGISDVGDENAQDGKDVSQRLATSNAAKVVLRLLQEIGG